MNTVEIDLHLHSTCSDGTLSPENVVAEAARRGLKGVSLTDHNGLWGLGEAAAAAKALDLHYVEGLEISASYNGTDVHLLGYSQEFKAEVMQDGLAATRAGYNARITQMVELCQKAGYPHLSVETIAAKRAHLAAPAYVSFDVTELLQKEAGLSATEARRLTVRGGACYVPYGNWALTLQQAIDLVHQAGGVAVLAHPGIIAHESGAGRLKEILNILADTGLDGVEVYHPFHTEALVQQLLDFAQLKNLVITGGSDWHGPDRFTDSDLGNFGITVEDYTKLLDRLTE